MESKRAHEAFSAIRTTTSRLASDALGMAAIGFGRLSERYASGATGEPGIVRFIDESDIDDILDGFEENTREQDRLDAFEPGRASAVMAGRFSHVFEGVVPPQLLTTLFDQRSDYHDLFTRILIDSSDRLGDQMILEQLENLMEADDDTFELNKASLLPEIVVKSNELKVAIDFEEGIPEKFGVNCSKDGDQLNAWDRWEFEPFEHSGVGRVEAHLYSDPRTQSTEARLEIAIRPGVFDDGVAGLARLQKIRQFVLRGHHLDIEEDKSEKKFAKGKQYRIEGGGTGVYYDYNDKIYVVVEQQRNSIVMRAVMKDIGIEQPDSDDSAKREWTEESVKYQLRIMHMLGPDFVTRSIRLLSAEDDVMPEFSMDIQQKDYHAEAQEAMSGDDEDMNPYMPGSGADRLMSAGRSRIDNQSEDDIYIPEGMVIPEVLNNDTLRKLYATTKKRLDPEFIFDNIGGIDVPVEKMRRWAQIAMRHEEYAKDNLQPRTAILLASEPGFGKSMTIQACAHLMGAEYFKVTSSDINDQYAGNTEKFTRAIFDMARLLSSLGPVVLHLNEIDTLFSKRGGDGSSDYEIKQLGQVLTLLEERYPGVLIVGDTNHADSLDAALKRLGRIDDVIQISRPDESGLGLIIDKKLKFHTSGDSELVIAENFDLTQVSAFAAQYRMNGTEINSAIERAILFRRLLVEPGSEHVPQLTQEMVITQLGEIKKLSLNKNRLGMTDQGEVGIDQTVAAYKGSGVGANDGR